MRQTLALFLDAYRELNAKRLFWIVLILSGAIILAIAILGNNDRGMTILGYTIEVPFFSTKVISTPGFYKLVFSSIGVQIWLAWGATILALISTASLIPDFVSSGSIELSLSKPISRLRLFLTKYITGLLFVTLQVVVFSVGAFLVIGLRGGSWEPTLFLAIPLVVVFFSYLFCISVLVGLVTRSAITALLLTMLFWVGLWAVNQAELVLLNIKVDTSMRVERQERQISSLQSAIARIEASIAENPAPVTEPENSEPPQPPAEASPPPPPADDPPPADAAPRRRGGLQAVGARMLEGLRPRPAPTQDSRQERLAQQRRALESTRTDLESSRATLRSLTAWHGWLFRVKTLVPKTGETTNLLNRYVITTSDRDGMLAAMQENARRETADAELQRQVQSRSVAWVIGTSLAFEALVLALAALIFCRRDF